MITVDFLGQTALCDQQWGNKEAQVHQTVTVKVKYYWKVKIMRIRYTQGGHDQQTQVYCKVTKEKIRYTEGGHDQEAHVNTKVTTEGIRYTRSSRSGGPG